MTFKKGNFVLLDYVGRVEETNEVFDTTDEDLAREEGLYKEGGRYEPMLVIIGEGWVLKSLDDSLLNLKLRKTETIKIPPEDGFGNRDPKKIKLYPLKKIKERGITPRIGMRIEVDRKLATIRTIGSGRILLDFNLPLAGKTLLYKVTIQKKLTTKKNKIDSLIARRLPFLNKNKISFDITKNQVDINIPEDIFYVEGLQIAKRGISIDIQKFFPKVKCIKFIEKFVKEESVEVKPSPTQDSLDN